MKLHGLLLTSHQWPGTFSRCTLVLPPTRFTEVKSSFFILLSNSGPCLFQFIWYSWRPERISEGHTCLLYNKRGRDIFGFRWVRGNFETLCNGAAKVLKDCESAEPATSLRIGSSDKKSPCCIRTEWRATSSRLWVSLLLYKRTCRCFWGFKEFNQLLDYGNTLLGV